MYAAIAQWVSWLPGGLMHSNVVACAVWGAPSGSSVATAVTVGTVAMGEIKKHKYNEPLFLGTIAAGGTLGILIPPSINMMVATIPITTPIVVAAGYDPVWYGILVVLLMETALLTPPVGMNLFVVQGIRERGDLNDVIIGTAPFIVTLFLMIGLIVAFPGIAMWLPNFLN